MTIKEARNQLLYQFPFCLCQSDFTDGTPYCAECNKKRIYDIPEFETWVKLFLLEAEE